MTAIEQRRFVARGRVQGVNFRSFVASRANEIGVRGWVRNLPDGRTVEAVAQGTREQLDRFAQKTMRQGPQGAFVSEFEEFAEDAAQPFDGFNIRG